MSLEEFDTEILTINAGGTLFQTLHSTIQNWPYLCTLLKMKQDSFIDIDPVIFTKILNFLRGHYYVADKQLIYELDKWEVTNYKEKILAEYQFDTEEKMYYDVMRENSYEINPIIYMINFSVNPDSKAVNLRDNTINKNIIIYTLDKNITEYRLIYNSPSKEAITIYINNNMYKKDNILFRFKIDIPLLKKPNGYDVLPYSDVTKVILHGSGPFCYYFET
jgi:hypothetical protein